MKPHTSYQILSRPARCLAAALAGPLLLPVLLLTAPAQSPPDPAGQTEEPMDIRGPRELIELPEPAGLTASHWTIILVLTAAAAGLVWFFLARRRRRRTGPGPAAIEIAREDLRAIDQHRETLPADAFAEQTANAIRRFIAAQFGLAAPQRTTEEFLQSLTASSHSPLAPHRDLLRDFLTTCDRAKFAGAGFDPVQRFELLETALRFLQSAARNPLLEPAAPAVPEDPSPLPPSPPAASPPPENPAPAPPTPPLSPPVPAADSPAPVAAKPRPSPSGYP